MKLKKEVADKIEKAMKILKEEGIKVSPVDIHLNTEPVRRIGDAVPCQFIFAGYGQITFSIKEEDIEVEG